MHPSHELLAGLAYGTINEDRLDEITEHVGQCTTCEAYVRELEDADDFMRPLRESPIVGKYEIEPEFQKSAIAAMNTLPAAHDRSIEETLSRAHVSEATIPCSTEQGDIPTELGNYVILGVIGVGGMGQVFKAEHKRMHRVVALKILPRSAFQSPNAIQRFQQEVTAAARLSHPNIVTAHDADEADGVHFLVMEYVEGSDLSSLIKQSGPLHPGKAVNYVVQVARGLAYAHAQGVIHRDIKPANLLLDKKGTVKILDMGLAQLDSVADRGEAALRLTDSAIGQGNLTLTGSVMGTIDYMPPEQAIDSKHADHRADIYSLGCTLFYLLTGNHLYSGQTIGEKLLAHRNQPIPSLREARHEIPEGLDAVYRRMVAKAPNDRYQSMTEALQALESVVLIAPASARKSRVSVDVSRDQHWKVENLAFQQKVFAIGSVVGIAFVLLALLYMTGVIFKFETHGGTVVLEIDQPELIGAEVFVDGEKRITITTADGNHPVKIRVDETSGKLEVRKGGFTTFTKAFSLASGGKETIRVSLIPNDGEFSFSTGGSDIRLVAERVIKSGGKVDTISLGDSTQDTDASLEELHRLCPNLQAISFSLKGTRITDDGLAHLAGYHIVQLNLGGTAITGAGVKHLQELGYLGSVDLSDTKITDDSLERVGELTSLRGLHLNNLPVTDAGLQHIERLQNLVTLDLRSTQVTGAGLEHLSGLTKLQNLPLDGLSITDNDLRYLKNLTDVQDLGLTRTEVTGVGFEHLTGMTKLRILSVGQTPFTDKGLEFVKQMTQLKQLQVPNTEVTDSGLKHIQGLTELNSLYLGGTRVSDAGLAYLKGLKKLSTLDLTNTKVTAAGVAELQKALPDCKIMHESIR